MRMKALSSILAVATISCNLAKDVKPDPHTPGNFLKYQETLIKEFQNGGFVIAKNRQSGAADQQGDSLLFSGLALSVVDCHYVPLFLEGLEHMQDAWLGYLVRYLPLPQNFVEKHDVVTRDGISGAMYGLVKSRERCPEFNDRIEHILDRWKEAVGSSYFLHPQALNGIITPTFSTFLDVIYGRGMGEDDKLMWMMSAGATAAGIIAEKGACYPIHLQTVQNLALENEGHPMDDFGKKSWCKLVSGRGLLLTDWYCGHDLTEVYKFLVAADEAANFYMHQRCSWEERDGENRLSPRVDFLLLYRLMEEGSK